MKGSDKWGTGSGGPRIELVIGALLVISVLGVYLVYSDERGLTAGAQSGTVATITTTGLGCDSDGLPGNAQQVEQDTAFTNLSDGTCYNYLGETSGVMTFASYNGTIIYQCGDVPLQVPQSEIEVDIAGAQNVTGARMVTAPVATGQASGPCDQPAPVDVVSVEDDESTIPAVPQLNITLAAPAGAQSITSLQAILTLDGGSQKFEFGGVSARAPLGPSMAASTTEIIDSNISFNQNEVYPMTVSGTFVGGQTFSFEAHVEIAQVP
jgi:hypothetical protein